MKDSVIEIGHHGLKCDNPKCDYMDESIEPAVWDQYINRPCPKCGQNLLTLQDYTKAILFLLKVEKMKNFYEKTWIGKLMAKTLKSRDRLHMTFNAHGDTTTITKTKINP